MKFAALALAVVAAVATVDASAHSSANVHIRVHMHTKGDEICYKQCPSGQWCAKAPKDKQKCRAPTPNTTECFNYATGMWIGKCDSGFECKLGKCEQKGNNNGGGGNNNQGGQNTGTPGGPICYKGCPSGQWCARNPTDKQTCRAPTPNTSECFDLSQGLWIAQCGPGFSCKGGKCA